MSANSRGFRVRVKWIYVEDPDRFGLLAAAIVSPSPGPATLADDQYDSDQGDRCEHG